jgi:hypothetical protein
VRAYPNVFINCDVACLTIVAADPPSRFLYRSSGGEDGRAAELRPLGGGRDVCRTEFHRMMILWTIQPFAIWEALERSGELVATSEFVEKDYLFAYHWMVGQMIKRLAIRPHLGRMPIWAWYQYRGRNRRRPDLRSTAHLPRAMRGARIEFVAEPEEVLLSDFELWHYVLNCCYLPCSYQDEKCFEKELRETGGRLQRDAFYGDVNLQRKMSDSWERIFHLNWHHRGYAAPLAHKSVQACLWSIKLEQVRRVSVFRAR